MTKLRNCTTLLVLFAVLLITVYGQGRKVSVSFTVVDEGGEVVRDLNPEDIRLQLGKQAVSQFSLESKADLPVEAFILIEASAGDERSIENGKKAAIFFVENVLKAGKDKVGVAARGYLGAVKLTEDMTADFSKVRSAINKIKLELPPGAVSGTMIRVPMIGIGSAGMSTPGSTKLWDGVRPSIEVLAGVKSSDRRKVFLLISHGAHANGSKKMFAVIESSVQNQISVFSIGVGDDYYGGVDKKNLQQLADATNGIAIIPDRSLSDLPLLMETLEQRLRFTHEVTFDVQSLSTGGRPNELKIELAKELSARKLRIIQQKASF